MRGVAGWWPCGVRVVHGVVVYGAEDQRAAIEEFGARRKKGRWGRALSRGIGRLDTERGDTRRGRAQRAPDEWARGECGRRAWRR